VSRVPRAGAGAHDGLVPAPILVAEDDAQHRLLICAAFAAARLANPIHIVEDGEQAVTYLGGAGEYADRRRYSLPALILLDLHMPGRSGLEVLAWLKTHGAGRVPVIVLTASEEEDDINEAFAAGAGSYLVKPVGFDALLDVIRNLDLRWLVLPPADHG
jgi:CheY-like chemotaxis protein